MQNFLYKLNQFMYGRNGIDGLGIFLFALSFLLRYSRNGIVTLISLILLILMVFRFLSRNVLQRRKENDFFMFYFRKVYSWFNNQTTLAKERAKVKETHKIYLCPKCHKKLKVPKGRGKIEISCPCGNKFKKRT